MSATAGASLRVGWLGGSFNPVHEGHLHVARVALDRLALDQVLLVPARAPPHKLHLSLAPGDDRLALLRLACADDPRLVPCDLELSRQGPSYSVDTARELGQQLPPGARIFALVGADTLADLPTWRSLAELAERVTFCAVSRPGTVLSTEHLIGVVSEPARKRIAEHLLEVDPHPASSTEVRRALQAGEAPPHLNPDVLAEIRRRGLYSSQAGGASSMDRSGSKRR